MPSEQTKSQSEVEKAALHWWRMYRPVDWNYRRHAGNPTVNCVTPAEYRLALAVAKNEECKRAR